MGQTVEAMFDGEVFRPSQAVPLEPNTKVELVVTVKPPETGGPKSFLKVARSLRLSGPEDWSANLDEYLYGDARPGDE